MTRAASVSDKNGYYSEIGGMAYRRLNSDLQRDAANGKGRDPAIAQSELQRSSLEGGHSELVEHELVVSWSEFGHKFEGSVANFAADGVPV
jgi:hypothetical protein